MIKGHFPRNCFELFMPYLGKGKDYVFTIRDKYLNSKTDSGMNYHGALADYEKKKLMKKID